MAYQAQPPAGLLQPLLVPHCPWSLWFPWTLSQICPSGDTTILTIDRFSKMVHFVPLPELPSKKQQRVCCTMCLVSMVSLGMWCRIEGQQFVSCFWKTFFTFLAATISLSLGFHSQSNGQTEMLNQELETGLLCLVSQLSWSKHLIWVEYAHNRLPNFSSGL